MFTKEQVAEFLSYDPATGVFIWLKRAANCVVVGSKAGYVAPDGYWMIKFKGKLCLAHRLAYLLMAGEWPEHDIDHENRIRSDNRWSNLRPATATQNQHNRSLSSNNKSGVTGVCWNANAGKWRAYRYVKSKAIHLGDFATKDEAVQARKEAELTHMPFRA